MHADEAKKLAQDKMRPVFTCIKDAANRGEFSTYFRTARPAAAEIINELKSLGYKVAHEPLQNTIALQSYTVQMTINWD